ncbi:ubiquitin-related domain-containing protein [Dichomitus squalens]|uniref:Ubiquitin-related domain-containing protein n=1 Tax=Dichomitus squalens TaxID=114155 RepID=A0A4Q9MKN9_9APHY|nr:ubiquitin-related domain-containing protein [Dichomitus squalens]
MAQTSLDPTHTPATVHARLPRPASIENALALQAAQATFSPLCPSARTSYTRVDFSGANTPRGDFVGVDAHDDDDDDDDGDEENGRQDGRIGEEGGEGAREEPAIPQTPQVSLTFLLVSGRRRTMSFEPETTVGRVKELVWNAWPNDWQDERPPAPSYLRILYLGKILQDEDSLDKVSFPTSVPSSAPASTIVHLSIRAYAPQAEDVPKKKRRGANASSGAAPGDAEDQAGCCSSCVIC